MAIRIATFFLAILLLFSATSVGFTQQNPIQAQAEADAQRDVDRDMQRELWFTLGLVSSSAGFVTGCVGGCLLGIFIDADHASFIDDPATSCGIVGAVLLGVLAVPAAVFIAPHNPSPPPERLLGKTPEYIKVYAQVYRSEIISLRKRSVTAGSLTSNLGVAGTILLILIADQ